MKKWWPLWVMLWLAVLLILCGILTILHPSGFWKWINILLWISLIFSGLSAIINAISNQKAQYISFLFVIWILILMLWIMLICARDANLVGKLTVWMFALWALMRWWMLIFFWMQNRNNMPLWWGICIVGIVLIILSIVTFVSSAWMANLVWICVWISIVFDWLSLLFFSLKWGNTQVMQAQVMTQANENEIAQWDVVITETTVTLNNTSDQPQN